MLSTGVYSDVTVQVVEAEIKGSCDIQLAYFGTRAPKGLFSAADHGINIFNSRYQYFNRAIQSAKIVPIPLGTILSIMSDKQLKELCLTCRRMFQNLEKMQRLGLKSFSTSLIFADVEQSEMQGCGLCATILTELPSDTLQSLQRGRFIRSLPVTLRGGKYTWNKNNTVTLRIDCGGLQKVEISIYHWSELWEPAAELVPHRNDSAEVLSLALRWFQDCVENHPRCNVRLRSLQSVEQRLPTRLIYTTESVAQLRTTENLPRNTKYATLSHCWGSIELYKLIRTNFHSIQDSITLHDLPRTFQDALFLTRRFGLDYIWIDSLCIIQDDQDDWRHESALMASVYGGSTLNIAAAHAKDGREGCFVDRNPKRVVPCSVTLNGEEYRCVPASVYSRGVNNTALSRRAWAFQERFLSPRTLLFGASQVFWECQEDHACETFPNSLPSSVQDDYSVFLHDDGRLAHCNMDSAQRNPAAWSNIVLIYSAGLLTHESDKLVAISGVARWMQRLSKDDYLAGLWRRNMEWQLLWSVNSQSSIESTSMGAASNTYRAPSWSWASRNGIIRQLFSCPTEASTSGYDLLIEVLSASTDTLIEDDPFGQVTSGFVKISCYGIVPLMSVSTTRGEKISIDYKTNSYSRHNSASLFWDENTKESQSFHGVWLLPVWAIDPTKFDPARLPKMRWGGLLLRKHNGNLYKRVGRADMYVDMNHDIRPANANFMGAGNESRYYSASRQGKHSEQSFLSALYMETNFDAATFVQDPNVDHPGRFENFPKNLGGKLAGLYQGTITLV